MNEKLAFVLALVISLAIKFVFGVVLASYVIAHGLALMNIDISVQAIGWIIIGVWLISGALITVNLNKNN